MRCSIPGFESYYEASNYGKIRSLDRMVKGRNNTKYPMVGKILRPTPSGNGYLHVTLCIDGQEKTVAVHRLVALAFIGSLPEGWQVHHRNGIRSDNRLSNLQPLEGKQHASMHAQGEKHPHAMLNDTQVKEVKELIAQGYADAQIAPMFGVARNTIGSIRRGKTWTHIHPSAISNVGGAPYAGSRQFVMPAKGRDQQATAVSEKQAA
jgi:hypothetical protein